MRLDQERADSNGKPDRRAGLAGTCRLAGHGLSGQVTGSSASRTTTSPKSASASSPGRCDCRTNTSAGPRPVSF